MKSDRVASGGMRVPGGGSKSFKNPHWNGFMITEKELVFHEQ